MSGEVRDADATPSSSSGIENCNSSVQVESSSAGSSSASSKNSPSQSAATEKHAYNTRGTRTKLMNDTSLMVSVPKLRSQDKKVSNTRSVIRERYFSSKGRSSNRKRREKPHKCNKCKKSFTKMLHLKTHQSVHTTQRPFQCSICNQNFKYSSHRNLHKRTVHEDGGFYCAYCDRKFPQKHQLIGHISTQHLPKLEKPYKCATCNKSFALKTSLNVHQSVHISERLHKCSMCDKCFKSNHYKLLHERNMHAECFRYSCADCERGFRTKRGLSYHVQRPHL